MHFETLARSQTSGVCYQSTGVTRCLLLSPFRACGGLWSQRSFPGRWEPGPRVWLWPWASVFILKAAQGSSLLAAVRWAEPDAQSVGCHLGRESWARQLRALEQDAHHAGCLGMKCP